MLSFSSNFVLMVLKLAIGLMFGSVAVLGDGIDSAEDVVASGLALFAVRLALQPADERHPYGHGKAESLAATSQAALIGGGAVFITVTAVLRLADGGRELRVGPSLGVMAVTVVVNLAVGVYAFRAARTSGSVAVASDARHLLTNVVQASAVILALVLVGLTGDKVYDPIVALGLAAYLAYTAVSILREAVRELIDSALPQDDVKRIEACLARQELGLRGYHALRTRKSGRETHVDLHVLVDPAISVSTAHELVEQIERDIQGVIGGAILSIHVDPDEPGILERGGQDEPARVDTLRFHRH